MVAEHGDRRLSECVRRALSTSSCPETEGANGQWPDHTHRELQALTRSQLRTSVPLLFQPADSDRPGSRCESDR